MASLEQNLGISDMLIGVDQHMSDWGVRHRELGALVTLDDFTRATNTGTFQDRDDVLLALAARAATDGGDSVQAAAVMCHLLIPGVVSRLFKTGAPTRGVSRDELNLAAAEHLWMQCRTFPWRTHRKVAASITWAVRRATLADFGLGDVSRRDRTWAATDVCGAALEASPAAPAVETPGDELAEILSWAEASAVLTPEDVDLLVTLVNTSRRLPARRVTTNGLLSSEVSQAVADQLSIGASTVRRRVARSLAVLQAAARVDRYTPSAAA